MNVVTSREGVLGRDASGRRRVCKRTNEAFALSKNLSNAQQVFRLIYVAEGRIALDPFLTPF